MLLLMVVYVFFYLIYFLYFFYAVQYFDNATTLVPPLAARLATVAMVILLQQTNSLTLKSFETQYNSYSVLLELLSKYLKIFKNKRRVYKFKAVLNTGVFFRGSECVMCLEN